MPKARKYQSKSFPLLDSLELLFDGEHFHPPHRAHMHNHTTYKLEKAEEKNCAIH
jgi:hypothetical protein